MDPVILPRKSRQKWLIPALVTVALAGIATLYFFQIRSRNRTAVAIERLAELMSEPALGDEGAPISQHFTEARTALAKERGLTADELKREFDHFDSGFIPGVRPTGYRAALADLANGRFATALREVQDADSSMIPRSDSNVGPCELLAGEILTADGRRQEAAGQLRLAIAHLDSALHGRGLAVAKMRLADALLQDNRDEESEVLWREALAVPGAAQLPAITRVNAETRYGTLLRKLGRPADAERAFANAETMVREVPDADPLLLARLANNHGLALSDLNRLPEAEASFRAALTHAEKTSDDATKATISGNLGFVIGRQGRAQEAEPLVQQTMAYVEKMVRDNPFSTAAKQTLELQLHGLIDILHRCEKYKEEEIASRRLYEVIKGLRGSQNIETADLLISLGYCQQILGKPDDAEKSYHEAIEILEKVDGTEHLRVARPLNDLAVMLRSEGRYAEAVRLLRRAMEITDQNLAINDPRRAVTMGNLGALMAYTGEPDQGEVLIRRAISMQTRVSNGPDVVLASMFNNLADSLVLEDRRADAVQYYKKALSVAAECSRRAGKDLPELVNARTNYQACLKALNTPEEEVALKVEEAEKATE